MTTGSEEDSEDSEPEDDPDETAVGLEHNEDVGAELADNTENVTLAPLTHSSSAQSINTVLTTRLSSRLV